MLINCVLMVLNGVNAYGFRKRSPFMCGASAMCCIMMFLMCIDKV